jgi:sugar lactone lactonase YvrE
MPRAIVSQLRCVLGILGLVITAGAPATVRADIAYFTSFTTGALVRYDTSNPAGTATVLSGSGSTVKPSALAIGPDGNLYIGEAGDVGTYAPRISRFNLSTNSLSVVHTFAAFDVFPGSLAFKGSDLLVGRNPFFQNTGPIVKLAGATGGVLGVSDYTTGGTLASSPGLALAADGSLYVSDQTYDFQSGQASGPVKRFDPSGVYVGEVVASGSNGLFGPTGLAINGSTLFTASIMAGTIVQTNLTTDATSPFASAVGPFGVGSLALLSDGGLLAGNPSGSGAIYRFGSDGTLLDTYSTGLGQIGGIVAVPEPSAVLLVVAGVACTSLRWLRSRRRA